MNTPIWINRTTAMNNGDFISIQADSGYRLAIADPKATEYLLDSNVSDDVLGQTVLDSLKQSRFLSIDEARDLKMNNEKNYKNWIQKLMDQYGYKTKRALFKNMHNCSIESQNGIITIHPSHHEKLEAWDGEGFTEEDYVKISADSSSAEIGAALRLAFSRCTG